MKTFVIGDIHGNIHTLEQCLERSGFNNEEDLLITLGDYVDGWPDSKKVIEKLLTIKHLVAILGNHDVWLLQAIMGNHPGDIWTEQGGLATQQSYRDGVPQSHVDFLKKCVLFHEMGLENEYVFVHGGLDPNQHNMNKQDPLTLLWDRDLLSHARLKHYSKENFQYGKWKKIFIGHTTVFKYSDVPVKYCNVIAMDTGGGWEGKLSIMNVDTEEVFQSDCARDFYPNHVIRMRGTFLPDYEEIPIKVIVG